MTQVSMEGRLILDHNNFSGTGVHVLAGILHLCPNLNSITMSYCGVTSDDMVNLFDRIDEIKSFGDCRRLRIWSLTNNDIGVSGLAALMKHVQTLFPNLILSLTYLDGNNVSDTDFKTLREEIKEKEVVSCTVHCQGCHTSITTTVQYVVGVLDGKIHTLLPVYGDTVYLLLFQRHTEASKSMITHGECVILLNFTLEIMLPVRLIYQVAKHNYNAVWYQNYY